MTRKADGWRGDGGGDDGGASMYVYGAGPDVAD